MKKYSLVLALILLGSALFAAEAVYREEIYSDYTSLINVKAVSLSLNVEFSGAKQDKASTDLILKRIKTEIMDKLVRKYLAKKGFKVIEKAGSPALCFIINLKRVKNKWSLITPEARLKQEGNSTLTPWLAQVRSVTVDDRRLFDMLKAVFLNLCGQFADGVDYADKNLKKDKI
jgi:hypothetical protein